jgi:hypothetical protein
MGLRSDFPRKFIFISVFLSFVLTCALPIPAVSSSSPTGGADIAGLDPSLGSQLPPVQPQAAPQNTQGVTANTNTNDTANFGDVSLLSSSSYIDSIGSLHVVGELQNTSPEPREFVEIVATLRDPSGNILDSSFTFSEVEVLRPGEKSPFDVIFSNEQQVQKTQRYEISSITSEISQEKPANLILNVGDTFYDSINSAHVVGEVTNNGPGVSRFTQVSGTFYDNQGKTVATEFTFTDPQDLQPGQSAPFDMIISDENSAEIVSGSLNVQSSEFAMILPAVVFEMSGQSGGDPQEDIGSLGGGTIDGSSDEGGNGDDGDDVDDGNNGGDNGGDDGGNGGDGSDGGDGGSGGDGGDGGDGGGSGTIDPPSLFG